MWTVSIVLKQVLIMMAVRTLLLMLRCVALIMLELSFGAAKGAGKQSQMEETFARAYCSDSIPLQKMHGEMILMQMPSSKRVCRRCQRLSSATWGRSQGTCITKCLDTAQHFGESE